jgi:uncharacterized protein YrrD
MLTSLHLGAKVEGSDGKDIGSIKYLVAEPDTNRVTHFVVERSGFETGEVVVEAAGVQSVSEDGKTVRINVTEGQVDRLPPFVEREYESMGVPNVQNRENAVDYSATFPSQAWPGVQAAGGAGFIYPVVPAPGEATVAASNAYDNVPVASTNLPLNPNLATSAQADVNGPVGIPYTEKRNVPEDSLIIPAGASVEATDGKVGTVKEANFDSATGRLVSFTVEKGLFFKDEFIVPVELVDSTAEDTVTLWVSKDDLQTGAHLRHDDANLSHDAQ